MMSTNNFYSNQGQMNNTNPSNIQNPMNMNMNANNPINPINNQMAINQMNQYMMNQSGNNLYTQNFQQTWQNMQQNVNLIETNFNNMTNILSLINLPVVVPYHNQHPLINCKTPGRKDISQYWICNGCGKNYSYNVPTFYCTACDFDLCQKCLLSLSAFMIVIYNYNQSNIFESHQFLNISCYKPNAFFSIYNYNQSNIDANPPFINNEFFKPNVHNHPIVRIIREPTYSPINLKCNKCFKDFQKEEAFYYCSLCNYCICISCYNILNLNPYPNQYPNPYPNQNQNPYPNPNQEIKDPYLHGDQMNPNC